MLGVHVDSDSKSTTSPRNHHSHHSTDNIDSNNKSTLSSRHRKKSLMIDTTFSPSSILSTNLTNIIAKLTRLLERLVTDGTKIDDNSITDEDDDHEGLLLSREEMFDTYWMQWMHFRKHPLWMHHKDLLDDYTKKHIETCIDHLYHRQTSKNKLYEIVKVLEEDVKNVNTKDIKLIVATKLLAFTHSKAVWNVKKSVSFVNSINVRGECLNELIQKLKEEEEKATNIFERIKTWLKELTSLSNDINVISIGSVIGVLILVLGILYSYNRRRLNQ